MILKRFYDEPLAQASYLVGCQATGEAVVVDPIRDIAPYLAAARSEGLRITHVTETHIHADFVSGARELFHRLGAQLYLSGEGGSDWAYRFADEDRAILLRDGDHFKVGNVRFDVLHTPGHTPEHLTFLVTDTAGANRPMGAFTGDFVFVGDVGRPDLLERAAKVKDTMESSARDLFRSLQRFRELDDWLQIWPGHGAGSACGKGLGAVPTSTLGYERLFNWGFSHRNEDEFVRAVLGGQPEAPVYFAEMKRINRDGPELLGTLADPTFQPENSLAERLGEGAVVVDSRGEDDFANGHVPGTLNIPLDRRFTPNAGWVLPYDVDIFLIVHDEDAGKEAIRHLRTIGLDRVRGLFPASSVLRWQDEGGPLGSVGKRSTSEVAESLEQGTAILVDVRWKHEWESGHIPGSLHIPMGYLDDRWTEIPLDRRVVLACATGSRSAIAASLLQARGLENVANMIGGIGAWIREKRPVVHDDSQVGSDAISAAGMTDGVGKDAD